MADIIEITQQRDSHFRKQLENVQEINRKRENLKWCYRREGVNHLQNCRELSLEYISMISAPVFTAYKK